MPDNRSTKAIVFTFANGVNFLINFLTLPYLARSLSYQDYGSYSQLLIIGSFLILIFGIGMCQVLNVIFVENAGNEKKVFSTIFNLHILSGLLGIVLLSFTSKYIANIFSNDKLALLLIYYSPSVVFQLLATFLNTTLVFFNKVKAVSIITVLANATQIILLLVAIQGFHSIFMVVLSINIATFLFLPVRFACMPKEHREIRSFDTKIIRNTLRLSWPLFPSSLLGNGIIYMNNFIVGAMLPTKDFAIYRNGSIEIPFISTIYGSITTVMLPDLTKMFAEKRIDEVFALKRKISSITAGVVFPITIYAIIMSHYLIPLYLSSKYQESALIFAVYNLIVLLRINDYLDLLIITKHNRTIFYANAITFILEIVLSVLFVKLFGLTGAVLAVVIAMAILIGILLVRTLKVTNKRFRDYFDVPKLGKIASVSTIFSFGCFFAQGKFANVPTLIGITIFYFGFTYFLLLKMKLIQIDPILRLLVRTPK
jgi:O-antigen/teichoic acid export membrane protein